MPGCPQLSKPLPPRWRRRNRDRGVGPLPLPPHEIMVFSTKEVFRGLNELFPALFPKGYKGSRLHSQPAEAPSARTARDQPGGRTETPEQHPGNSSQKSKRPAKQVLSLSHAGPRRHISLWKGHHEHRKHDPRRGTGRGGTPPKDGGPPELQAVSVCQSLLIPARGGGHHALLSTELWSDRSPQGRGECLGSLYPQSQAKQGRRARRTG